MPEEQTRALEKDPQKPVNETSVEVRDIFGVPESDAEIWVDGKLEGIAEKKDAASAESLERSLKERLALPPTSQTKTGDTGVRFDADAIRQMDDAEARVQKLVDLALLKGPHHALHVADHIDAYTLDRTRDRLADELSEELRKRGMISEGED